MNKLKEIRERQGKAQAEVARDAGISRESFNALENGRTALVNRHLEPIAAALGVSPAEVLGYDKDPAVSSELEDIHSYYASRMKEMEDDFSRRILSKQNELDSALELLDSVRHSLQLSESINVMLRKQLNSSAQNEE